MPLGVAGASETEDSGRGHGDAHAVRDDGRVDNVPGVPVSRVLARDGVAHAVAEVDTCVAEADAREGGGQQHFALGFAVVGVPDCPREVLDCVAEGLEGEDVGDGVGALVSWAFDRVFGTGHTFRVGDCGPGFEGVAEDVEAAGGVHGGWHCACVDGVADAEGGFEVAMRDARFGPLRD